MMTPAIQTKDLTKVYRSGFLQRKTPALTDLNLEVGAGSIFGFLGPNGAGKTTTIKLLIGIIHPTSGQGFIFGKPLQSISVKKEIGFLPERPYFYDYLTGYEFLHFCGALFGFTKKERDMKIVSLLELVSLRGAEQTPLRKYSKGMLQRIGIAQALINNPKLVIFDEPMSGLDPVGRKEVRDIMLRLKAQGKTVFFSTHVLADAEMICDQVGMIVNGRLRNVGNLEEILNPKIESIELTIRGLSPDKMDALKSKVTTMTKRGDIVLITVADEAQLSEVISWTLQQKGMVVSVVPGKESLEDIFMQEIQSKQS
ncbi:MAG: ATP-binding cassette domain-containing protein [Nitrospiria bacterium]